MVTVVPTADCALDPAGSRVPIDVNGLGDGFDNRIAANSRVQVAFGGLDVAPPPNISIQPVPAQGGACTSVNLCCADFTVIGSGRVPASGIMSFAVSTDAYIDPAVSVRVVAVDPSAPGSPATTILTNNCSFIDNDGDNVRFTSDNCG